MEEKRLERPLFICAVCKVQIRRDLNVRTKHIKSNEEASSFSLQIGCPINIGDVLCNSCRLAIARNDGTIKRRIKTNNACTEDCTEVCTEDCTEVCTEDCTEEVKVNVRLLSPVLFESPPDGNLDVISESDSHIFEVPGPLPQPADDEKRRSVKPDFYGFNSQPWSESSSGNSQVSSSSTSQDPLYQPPQKQIKQEDEEYITLPINRTVATHKRCIICSKTDDLRVIPSHARLQVFTSRRIYIPQNNRCCSSHLIKDRFYTNELEAIEIHSNFSSIPSSELTKFLDALSMKTQETLLDQFNNIMAMPEEKVKVLTGFKPENIVELAGMLKTIRNTDNRSTVQALAVFLFKLRTGSSDEVVAATFGFTRKQIISEICDTVITAFEKDVLKSSFGFEACSREALIDNHTSVFAKELFNIRCQLALICDGTYLRHQKSTNNLYQRKSYSVQKKSPLLKPFTIATTDGFIIDCPTFNGKENDATILKNLLSDPNGISKLLRPGDVFIVDRGFRDIVTFLESNNYVVLMPSLKGKAKQLTTDQSNHSRFVTKLRWVVEAAHGILGQKFKLLHNQFDNKRLPKAESIVKIACFLYNSYVRRLSSDNELQNDIIERMKTRRNLENELTLEKISNHWERRNSLFTVISSNAILDFPELTEDNLRLFFTGSYQLKQAVSYLGELLDRTDTQTDFDGIPVSVLNDDDTDVKLLKVQIQSRHKQRQQYRCFLRYHSGVNTVDGILGYSCECPNGSRTIGSCSHIAALIYYLSFARYQAKILRPAHLLTNLFDKEIFEESEVIIHTDSEEED